MASGVTLLRMDTAILRASGMCVTPCLVDDVLVDAGPSHLGPSLGALLLKRPIRAVVLTHHHEDHAGNAGAIAGQHGAPVYLRQVQLRDSEGMLDMLPYRRAYWGFPHVYQPLEMPAQIETERRTLLAIPTPGHSATHTVFFDAEDGLLFSGDLYLSSGASAVLRYEDPFALVRSLRTVAQLAPRLLVSAHDHVMEHPVPQLQRKAERVEQAIEKVLALSAAGLSATAITRRVFPTGRAMNNFFRTLTWGEYQRGNFVRAVLALR